MTKEAGFTMRLEPALCTVFVAEAEAAHRPASQIMRDVDVMFAVPILGFIMPNMGMLD